MEVLIDVPYDAKLLSADDSVDINPSAVVEA
jgi:hypothetical protein